MIELLQRKNTMPKPYNDDGFTLIELMVALTVLALVMTYVIGSFGSFMQRQNFQAAAENLHDYLTIARTESINRNADLYVTIKQGTAWCYGLSTGVCDCNVANSCQLNGVDKVISSSNYPGIEMNSATFAQGATANYIVFNSRRGMPEDNAGVSRNGAISFLSQASDNLTVQVNVVGRLRTCSTTGYKSYPAC